MRVRRSRTRLWIAWLLFASCAGLVLFLGSDDFSAAHTHSFFGPIVEWLFPEWTAAERWTLHFQLRKFAHAFEYGVLALLAFHAVFVSLETLLGRIVGLALLLVLSVAAVDELRQAFSANRGGSIWDVALDLLGALIALGVAFLLLRSRDRKTSAGASTP